MRNNFSSYITTNKKLHLAALVSVVFLCAFSFLYLNPIPVYMDNTKATPAISSTELAITTTDIAMDMSVDSPTGTFKESAPAEISVVTDNYTGYVLTIAAKNNDEFSDKLVNGAETVAISSISGASSQNDFTNNTWGIKPSKINGNSNTNFIPAPSYNNSITIDTTNNPNTESNIYTLSMAARVDYSLPASIYSNTYIITAVGNPTLYMIEYNKNTDSEVSGMPEAQVGDTQSTSIDLSNSEPINSDGSKFAGWCDGTVAYNTGIPECNGVMYSQGDQYYFDQTKSNQVVLYAVWNKDATLLDGWSLNGKLKKIARYYSIEAIKNADAIPEDFTPTEDNLVSINGSPDIYAWWDDIDNAKTIYIYTKSGKIYANANCRNMFMGYSALKDISGISGWDTSRVTDMSGMFRSNPSLTDISSISNWDTSSVTNMNYMFGNDTSLADISGVSNWNTSNVTDMSNMFDYTRIANLNALSTGQRTGNNYVSWDTSNVTNMSSMFKDASSLTDISGISNWDTSNVTNMGGMFYYNSSLADISGVSNWNTSNVTDMGSMFSSTKIINLDALSTGQRTGNNYVSWDTSNVTNMGYMFNYIPTLADISGISNWNTSSVTNMSHMFGNNKITNLDALSTGQRTGNNYVSWDTSRVTDMSSMFTYDTTLADISGISSWDTSSVTDMNNMFSYTNIANLAALSTGQRTGNNYVSWDTSNVVNMESMFNHASSLTDISGISNWDTSNVTNMNYMFDSIKAANLNALSTGQRAGNNYVSWDTSNVTTMQAVFRSNSSLTDVSGISNWNTSKVTNMSGMFSGTRIASLDALSTGQRAGNDYISWDISHVTNTGGMFYDNPSLADISGISNWDTSNVTDMSSMFYYTRIANLNALSTGQRTGNNYVSWDTSNVKSMNNMFHYAYWLTDVSGISNWDTSNVTDMSYMFSNCTSITDTNALTPLNDWTINASLRKASMFDGLSSSVLRPTWY